MIKKLGFIAVALAAIFFVGSDLYANSCKDSCSDPCKACKKCEKSCKDCCGDKCADCCKPANK